MPAQWLADWLYLMGMGPTLWVQGLLALEDELQRRGLLDH